MSDRQPSKPPLIALFGYAEWFGILGALIGTGLCYGIYGAPLKNHALELLISTSSGAITGMICGFAIGRYRKQKPEQAESQQPSSLTRFAKPGLPESAFGSVEFFRPSKTKWLSLAVVTPPVALFLVWYASSFRAQDGAIPVMAFMLNVKRALIYFVAALIVYGFFVSMAHLVPGSSFLRISPEGMTVRWLWRTRFYRWSDIESFGMHGFGRVAFNLSPSCPSCSQHPMRSVNRLTMGFDSELRDNYGMAPAALAAYLSVAQERYLMINSSPDPSETSSPGTQR